MYARNKTRNPVIINYNHKIRGLAIIVINIIKQNYGAI